MDETETKPAYSVADIQGVFELLKADIQRLYIMVLNTDTPFSEASFHATGIKVIEDMIEFAKREIIKR